MTDAERAAKNRRLAELLGWKAEVVPKSADWVDVLIFNPSGRKVDTFGCLRGYEQAGIAVAFPDFCNSLDACASVLPADMHVTITWEADDLYYCRLWRDGMDADDAWRMDGDTRAEAFAEALLSYAEAKQNEETGGITP